MAVDMLPAIKPAATRVVNNFVFIDMSPNFFGEASSNPPRRSVV